MKLYLSSYRIPDPDTFSGFVGKVASNISIGLILNAQDYKSEHERGEKKKELFAYFRELNFDIEEVDLRQYDNRGKLRGTFDRYDVIWFNGGNTFCLRWVIKQSVLTKSFLEDMLESGMVYAGDSAGAIIAGPTLKYFDAADDPNVVSNVLYDGLNLIDFAILPHYESEKYGEVIKGIGEKLEEDGFQTKPLTDEEFILVDGSEVIEN